MKIPAIQYFIYLSFFYPFDTQISDILGCRMMCHLVFFSFCVSFWLVSIVVSSSSQAFILQSINCSQSHSVNFSSLTLYFNLQRVSVYLYLLFLPFYCQSNKSNTLGALIIIPFLFIPISPSSLSNFGRLTSDVWAPSIWLNHFI